MDSLDGIRVTGTLIWYYYVCHRQVWLIARQITPDKDHPSIELGRFIHDHSYSRDKKELSIGSSKMDIVRVKDGQLVIGEVKKSSRHLQSARMQLLFYLDELSARGISAKGELRFPEERRKEVVELTPEDRRELEVARREIESIVRSTAPPPPVRIRLCRGCGYAEFCWS